MTVVQLDLFAVVGVELGSMSRTLSDRPLWASWSFRCRWIWPEVHWFGATTWQVALLEVAFVAGPSQRAID